MPRKVSMTDADLTWLQENHQTVTYKDMALEGHDPEFISQKLSRPLRLIRDWLEIESVSSDGQVPKLTSVQ